ncbi:hypothetical protein LOZ12_002776 [Ophidiomyces ophidiicola]|uniref:Uncharacterized protein n=1 Tax=Ophidiomyces ophidiicola TaxID=1387563 RepID=A0ACB8V644_9EURO|nr:uncharacterized protein LOZ57_005255 [Ophidiomyces ophidiicola]KAI1912860.1 hypothetical protein LOZ61_003064 [Ophidiomyces ophidiicola]KAI1917595.1 hypothetical protein LOZ64_003075 [Ophidiomyces ophidiicola]KAI1930731.1 hypothetical protein LOZ60_000707 [Ophidiomyces ophidiicola]KAI1942958.1 hypothetical protein LOZ57_005255 [Ophidiomyces ophidiicola]KAI1952060.1 hypothetical protein LOZ62_001589 [Ophidiomyces ophidiicola]
MVGKVPGQRAKNGPRMNPSSNKRQSEEPTSRRTREMTTPPTEVDVDWGQSMVNFDQSVESNLHFNQGCNPIFDSMEISTDLPSLESSIDPSPDVGQWMGERDSSLPITNDVSPNNFDILLNTNEKRLSLLLEQVPFSQSMGLHFRPDSCTAGRNKCIQSCSDIIQYLERKMIVKLCALDDVIRICQTSISRLSSIMDTDEYTQSASCVPLSCIAVSHVISLLETCVIPEEASQPDRLPSPRNIQLNCTLPRITFGSLQVHQDDQLKFGCQVLQREVKKCGQLLTKLQAQQEKPMTQGSKCLLQMQEQFCSDFERRLEELEKILQQS